MTAQVAEFRRDPQPANAIMAELGLKHSTEIRQILQELGLAETVRIEEIDRP